MVIAGPAGLIPCFCKAPYTFLNASTSVSKAESQFAPPLEKTIVLAARVTSSPNASPGFCGRGPPGGEAAAGGGGAAAGGGGGAAGVAGAGGVGAAGGVWPSAAPAP